MSAVVFSGDTSGQISVEAPDVAGSNTLTLPVATDTLVGKATTDTLTNKTLTAPVIATIVNTGTLTLPTSTDTLVGRATTDVLTNKTLILPVVASIVNTGTLTLPTSTDTLVGKATTDTLTNKTLTAPVISTIVNTGTLTLPTSTDTLVGRATTDTLTNKTINGASNTITNVANVSYVVADLAALKALTTRPEVVVVKTGQAADVWQWAAGDATTANDGTVVQCTSGAAGRYKRIYNGYVYTAWFGTGITSLVAAWAVSQRIILTPGEEYLFSVAGDTLEATDEDIDIVGPQSHFKRADAAASVRFLDVVGTYELDVPVASINAAGTEIVVTDVNNLAGGILPGMTLKVMSNDELWHYWLNSTSGQFAEVATVVPATNTVTFTAPLKYATIALPEAFRAVMELDIDDVVNNGAGLFRVSCVTPHFRLSNQKVYIDGLPVSMATGEGEWVITVIDAYTFDLVGSTFAGGPYVPGGVFWPTFNFSPANGMHVGKLFDNYLRVEVGDLRMTSASASGTSALIDITSRSYMHVRHGYVPFIRGQLFSATNCFGGSVGGAMIQRGPGGTTGYGYVFNACENVLVENPQGGYIRHLVDAGSGGTTDGLQGRSSIMVRGGYSIGSQSGAVAFHHGCDECDIDGFSSRDGEAGIAVRGIDYVVTNPRSYSDASGVANFIQYMYDVTNVVSGTAGNCRITVNQNHSLEVGRKVRIDAVEGVPNLTNDYYFVSAVISTTTFEVAVAFAGAYTDHGTVWCGHAYSGEMKVIDPVIVLASGASGAIGTGPYTGLMTVIGGYVEAGGSGCTSVSASTYVSFMGTRFRLRAGIVNRIMSARNSLDLTNCKFVFDSVPPSRFIDARGTPDVVITAENVIIENPNGTLTDFYDAAAALPNAGSRIGPLTVTGAMTYLVDSQTINASRAFQTGPIRVAGVTLSDRTMVNLGSSKNETIVAGVITVTTNIVAINGEGNVADDLVTINGGLTGDLVILRMNSNGTITVKDGTGNIALGADRVLDDAADTLLLERRASTWNEVAFANNT
jgi:hypothetical protein